MKIIHLIALSYLLFSCSNDETYSSVYVSGNDIYIAGDINREAALWKNGEKINLDSVKGTESFANKIFVNGKDVYVVGDLNHKPVLWKNGKISLLDKKANFSSADGVIVYNNSVYVIGSVQYRNKLSSMNDGTLIKKDQSEVILWKNGEKTDVGITRDQGYHFLFITNQGVYVGGNFIEKNENIGIICQRDLSKVEDNVDGNFISDSAISSSRINPTIKFAKSVIQTNIKSKLEFKGIYLKGFYVSENDIYSIAESNDYENQYSCVIKNDKIIYKISKSNFNSIYVNGRDIYVGGSIIGEGAKLWKNGNMIDLSKGYYISHVNEIFVKGNDVYCVGNGNKSENGNWEGLLWKNGVLIE
jgi:hypothetical protein